MKIIRNLFAMSILLTAFASTSLANQTFIAVLAGINEVPPNVSTGIGNGTVVYDSSMNMIICDLSWSNMVAPATAAHIHGPALPGSNAPVLFPFSNVPAAPFGAISQQMFAITPAQLAQLQTGMFYMNIHSAAFPGGEIRGQLILNPVPEPSSIAGLTGFIGMGAAFLRRRKA